MREKVNGDEKEFDSELVDIIYIFTSPNEPGLKFYNRSSTGFEMGIFKTDKNSIFMATWDNKVNSPMETSIYKVREGSIRVKTFIVSTRRMKMILDSINSQLKNERIMLNIKSEDNLEKYSQDISIKSSKEDLYVLLKNINEVDTSQLNYDNSLKKL